MKKIFFSGSINGGLEDSEISKEIIKLLRKDNIVISEHDSSNEVDWQNNNITDEEIFIRDCKWIKESDILIAEVTVSSVGVGYEIGYSLSLGKRVICLFRSNEEKELSPMISGNKSLEIICYNNLNQLESILKERLI